MKIKPIAKSIIVLIGFFLLLSFSPPDIYSSKFNSSGDAFFWQVVGVSNAHAGKEEIRLPKRIKARAKNGLPITRTNARSVVSALVELDMNTLRSGGDSGQIGTRVR